MKLVLIGYMGAGKSTLGKALSNIMAIPFMDLDAYIEEQEEQSISSIFASKGEIYFRKKESYYLKEVLDTNDKLILATGGGTPCYGTVMQDLQNRQDVTTLYLNCSIDLLTERLWKEKASRPLIAHLDEIELLNDFIRKHLFERRFYYMLSDYTVDVDGKDQQTLLEEMVLKLF